MAAPPLMSPTWGRCEAAAPCGPLPYADGPVSNVGRTFTQEMGGDLSLERFPKQEYI